MPSKFRIPKASLDGPLGRLATTLVGRRYGKVPDGMYVYWHNQKVLRAVYGFESKVQRWKSLAPDLRSYAELASASVIGCTWCMDFGYYLAHNEGLDLAKLREVPRWRESEMLSDVEREVIGYAEAMTVTPPAVTDEQVASLVAKLGKAATVELTQIIALENMRSRFNASVGLEDQGYSSVCEVPLVIGSESTKE